MNDFGSDGAIERQHRCNNGGVVRESPAFRRGECQEMVELFQHLVDSGLAWELQGSYGRTAAALIEAGEITAR